MSVARAAHLQRGVGARFGVTIAAVARRSPLAAPRSAPGTYATWRLAVAHAPQSRHCRSMRRGAGRARRASSWSICGSRHEPADAGLIDVGRSTQIESADHRQADGRRSSGLAALTGLNRLMTLGRSRRHRRRRLAPRLPICAPLSTVNSRGRGSRRRVAHSSDRIGVLKTRRDGHASRLILRARRRSGGLAAAQAVVLGRCSSVAARAATWSTTGGIRRVCDDARWPSRRRPVASLRESRDRPRVYGRSTSLVHVTSGLRLGDIEAARRVAVATDHATSVRGPVGRVSLCVLGVGVVPLASPAAGQSWDGRPDVARPVIVPR